MGELLTFAVVAFLLVASPGPNAILILKSHSAFGRSAAVTNLFGITLATFFHGAFSIFGLSALLLQSAELFMVVKILGAAYLFYIGIKAIIQSFKSASARTNLNAHSVEKPVRNQKGFFAEGFLTQLLNPKVSMFYLAAFPQFISYGNGMAYLDAFLLVAIHASIIFCWFMGMTFAIDKMKGAAKSSALNTWMQRLTGSVMIYFSSLVLTQER